MDMDGEIDEVVLTVDRYVHIYACIIVATIYDCRFYQVYVYI